ncbi:MAG: hypothetical protein L3J73_05160, partial [Thermoplasmata archaeon]|nr:hypothetical protein [Thermoplasmata archaeon]
MRAPAAVARMGAALALLGVVFLLFAPPASAFVPAGNAPVPALVLHPAFLPPATRVDPRPGASSTVWSNVSVTTVPGTPACRSSAGFAWDPMLFEAILFGGIGPCQPAAGSVTLGDTWAYANGSWRNLTPTLGVAPSPRYGMSMAYDAAVGRVLLFGGGNGTTAYNDTWTFDARGWTRSPGTPAPAARTQAAMAYDARDSEMVLFGGVTNGTSPTSLSDTWVYHGGTWSLDLIGPAPSARHSAQMGSVATNAGVLLFGGIDAGASALSDTWSFTGGTWSVLNPTFVPVGRWDGRLTYDAAAGTEVLFGGCTAIGCATALNDTFLWGGGTWVPSGGSAGPSARGGSAIDFDPQSNYVVLFSGGDAIGRPDDTWAYLG